LGEVTCRLGVLRKSGAENVARFILDGTPLAGCANAQPFFVIIDFRASIEEMCAFQSEIGTPSLRGAA
jgi:hypothetical protein